MIKEFKIIKKNQHHGFYIIDELGDNVCDLYFMNDNKEVIDFENAEENARLIAQAPIMYKELKKQLDWLKHIKSQVNLPYSVTLGFEQSIKAIRTVLNQVEDNHA